MAVHPLQRRNCNPIFRRRYRQSVGAKPRFSAPQEDARGEVLLFPSLTQAAHVHLYQFLHVWEAEIKLVRQAIAPALRMPRRLKLHFEYLPDLLVIGVYQEIEIA